ncbi:MAG: TolC family protein [Pseudobdellovibrio sp.]
MPIYLIIIFVFSTFANRAFSLEGLVGLEQKLTEKNSELKSLQLNLESKDALNNSSFSGYYPTLNAIGGWGQNKTDELINTQKGYLGYLEGKLNLFKGFKDQSVSNQKKLNLKIAKIDFESKKRELRLQLTEIASDMIFLHKLQSILEDEYKVTQTQKQMAEKKVAAGLTGPVDKLEFELKETEIQIEQKQINQRHEEAHQKFIKLYTEEITDSELEKLDFSSFEKLTNGTDSFKIENTLDYQKADFTLAQVDLEKEEIKSEFLPSLDFSYSVGRLTPSEDSPTKFNESKYAVQLTLPLFSGFDTYYKTKAANLSSKSTANNKLQIRNNLLAEHGILKTKITESSQLYQLNEIKMRNSQKYFDLTLAEYKRGIKNSPDLISATERLFSTKKKKFELLKELEIFKIKIENF